MTGERALIAVISILWIVAALIAMPGVFLLGYAIVTNEDIPDLWQQIIPWVVQSLWFAVPAVFLARGSRIARGFAIYLLLIGLAAAFVFTIALIAAGLTGLALLAAPLALPFLFSAWALLFYRDLQVALVWRAEKWNGAEKARMKELEDAMGEGSEK